MPTIPNLSDREEWPDEDLDALRVSILTEKERRTRQDEAPTQMAEFTRTAIAAGCDPKVLIDTVTDVAASAPDPDKEQ